MRHRASIVALGALLACGEQAEKPAPTPTDPKSAPEPGGSEPGKAAPADTGDETAAATGGPVDGGDTTGGPALAQSYRGPCKITWSTGTVVRFKYTDTGGSVTVDQDGDGKRDTCGRFKLEDARTKSVSIDLECDRKTDFTIRPRYAKDANLAEATYTTTEGDEKTKRRVTLVTMTSFSGLEPGYPLPARRKDIDLTIEDERVRKAHVKEPTDGTPARLIAFDYDDEGRIERIQEDAAADGSVESSFVYRYDEKGNVTRITATQGEQKRTGRVDYSCWN